SVVGAVTSCTKTGPKSWKIVPGNNSTSPGWKTGTLSSPGSATYTFSCTGPGGTHTKSVTVTWLPAVVPAAPVVNITASPMIVDVGKTSLINWSVVGAVTSCTKTGPKNWKIVPGNNSTSPGWETGTLSSPGSATYTFSCSGPGGTDTKSVTVTWIPVPPPAITSFTASPNPVPAEGGTTTLNWTSTNATSCSIKLMYGGTLASGLGANSSWQSGPFYHIYSPKTYVLTCTGASGTNPATATVTVPIVPVLSVSLGASPTTGIVPGQSSKLFWSSSNAASCVGTSPINGLSGINVDTGPIYANKTFTITCTGITGAVPATITKSVTVTVN
ncbi:MAG: hypothetical protein ACKOW9_02635, partial [Candidatus Paceibacterota bacterium]